MTLSMTVISHFLAKGQAIAAIPQSMVRFNALRMLAVDLPVTAVTLKHRTLSPVVEQFIACAREVARAFVAPP